MQYSKRDVHALSGQSCATVTASKLLLSLNKPDITSTSVTSRFSFVVVLPRLTIKEANA